MPKVIKLAEYAGFCYGVKRAVETVKKLKTNNPDRNICILGELIHNSQVIEELNGIGIRTIDEIPACGDGFCVVRSHGEAPEIFEKLNSVGFEVVDLTCPDVKKVQQKAVELAKMGFYLVIIGKKTHPEVIAIKANAKLYGEKIIVTDDINELKTFEKELKAHKKIGVVVQTTQTFAILDDFVRYLTTISKELYIVNTICKSTTMRQCETLKLAQESDLMIVVGSKKSANTTHLAEISSEITKTIHIETANDLKNNLEAIKTFEKIGVTAGASTPQNLIDEVIEVLNNLD